MTIVIIDNKDENFNKMLKHVLEGLPVKLEVKIATPLEASVNKDITSISYVCDNVKSDYFIAKYETLSDLEFNINKTVKEIVSKNFSKQF